MIRKLVLTLGAVAVLAATAFAPTAASAKGKHWHGPHLGILIAAPADCYLVERTYVNKYGHLRTRMVEVCD